MKMTLPVVAGFLIFLIPALSADLDAALEPELASLEALYKELHRNPELSLEERRTAARIADELRTADFEVTTGVGGTGVVGVLRNGPGKTVMIRTDLDALPVVEQTGLPYASTVRAHRDAGEVGVMHACGHDMHMTSFVGAARMLSRLKAEWSGTLVMIGQPAEELGQGARATLRDGLFTRFPRPDFVLALHVAADLPAGSIGYRPGYALAAVDSVDIKIRGIGGHGAWPHRTRDPVVIAAHVITALQTIASRETDPQDAVVVTVGSIHGGTKHNIIGPEVALQLTVRTYSEQTRTRVLHAIERITFNTARALGVPDDRLPEVRFPEESTPATYNTPRLGERLLPVWQAALGPERVAEVGAVMGGEDFSEFGRTPEKIPIFMFWLGAIDEPRYAARNAGNPLPALHSPQFWPAIHPTIRTGVTAMTVAALDLFRSGGAR